MKKQLFLVETSLVETNEPHESQCVRCSLLDALKQSGLALCIALNCRSSCHQGHKTLALQQNLLRAGNPPTLPHYLTYQIALEYCFFCLHTLKFVHLDCCLQTQGSLLQGFCPLLLPTPFAIVFRLRQRLAEVLRQTMIFFRKQGMLHNLQDHPLQKVPTLPLWEGGSRLFLLVCKKQVAQFPRNPG